MNREQNILNNILSFTIKHIWKVRKRHIPPLLDANGQVASEAREIIKKILVTRFQCIGDMLIFIPTLKELRLLFPDAHICLFAYESSGIEAIKPCPYIDNIIKFHDRDNFIKKWFQRFYLWRKKFDMLICSCAEINIAREGFFAGVKYIVGFNGKKRFDEYVIEKNSYLFDIALPYDEKMHETYQNLKIVEGFGVKTEEVRLEYYVKHNDNTYISVLFDSLKIGDNSVLVGIHPGSKQAGKRWPAERFADVADYIVTRYQAQAIFVGSKEESVLVQSIIKRMKNPAIDLSGKTTIGELAALLLRLQLFLCNDSGPMHIAAALGVQLIALYGPGNYANWRPLSEESKISVIRHPVKCGPCFAVNCSNPICMKLISTDEVKMCVDRFLLAYRFHLKYA